MKPAAPRVQAATTVSRQGASLAIVHHGNQFLITDGYADRMGISDVVGTPTSPTGFLRILALHEKYRVPANLHLSGTLLEALAWHRPEFLARVRSLARLGLLEMVGGCYAQNIMRYFSPEHNQRQLAEELLLYETLLDWDPRKVTTFWPTERVWETASMAPALTDETLPNGGYRNVLLDDRLLHASGGNPSPRALYDYAHRLDPANFAVYGIAGGMGLRAIPISYHLRRNIPPRDDDTLERTKSQVHWLLDVNDDHEDRLLGVYADDMEKVAGVGWDPDGPDQFERFLAWVSTDAGVKAVRLGEWTATHAPAGERTVDAGAYVELATEFNAGENYDGWYQDPRWTPYRDAYAWSEARVRELESAGADFNLMELAWKALLASSWETAWHTPKTGAHGNRLSDSGPSPWARAVASHSRLAAIVAEAAHWMQHQDGLCHATLVDVDHDGDPELVLKSDTLFAVFSAARGGRLVYLFAVRNPPGRLVVGNPIDDWNLLEDLHGFMDAPPNHPGAFVDVGAEHDAYAADVLESAGDSVQAVLRNANPESPYQGLEKLVTLRRGQPRVVAEYELPAGRDRLSVEVGVSPDYLQLLRAGTAGVQAHTLAANAVGWSNGDLRVDVGFVGGSVAFEAPRQEGFGHGYLARIAGPRTFKVWVGAED